MTKFQATETGVNLTLTAKWQNADLLIELTGGDVPHYGVVTTVSVATAPQTISLPSRPGHVHQEGQLSEQVAAIIRPVLPGNAIIVCGVHVDNIRQDQMQAIFELTQQLAQQLKNWCRTQHPVIKTEHFANEQCL